MNYLILTAIIGIIMAYAYVMLGSDRIPLRAVANNDAGLLRTWLALGGNPNLSDAQAGSLLYIATGPHGGYEVTKALLEAGADPDGHGDYTPLMNAASWVALDSVRALLCHGADAKRMNAQGQKASALVGKADEAATNAVRAALHDAEISPPACVKDAHR